jgi:hypothetical protein
MKSGIWAVLDEIMEAEARSERFAPGGFQMRHRLDRIFH